MAYQKLGCPDIRDCAVHIYALCEPGSGEVRYVGKSTKPRARASSSASCGSYLIQIWIRGLRESGSRPVVRILQTVLPGDDVDAAERLWILEFDCPMLLNRRGTRVQRNSRIASDPVLAAEALRLGIYLPGGTRERIARLGMS